MEIIVVLLLVLLPFLIVAAIQHRKRHESIHHVLGVDMRGMDNDWGYREKVIWIKSQPGYRKQGVNQILYLWEQRDTQLDKVC
jgi:hypothetical protein